MNVREQLFLTLGDYSASIIIISSIIMCGFILDKKGQHENLEGCVCMFSVSVRGRWQHLRKVMASVCVCV